MTTCWLPDVGGARSARITGEAAPAGPSSKIKFILKVLCGAGKPRHNPEYP